ncbi:MAG: SsrA-binding protein SmpB [Abitibacteriaceae bacterium]|nr:SsrA-binding protein SmpB [Abditibacteriaceae bacterium]MBV9867845.1 SsrA-binding protein SmpB [Abditibacteriaceae bacterium]
MAKDKKAKEQEKKVADRTIAVNRRGRFSYDIEESLEVGMELTGTEVKSARQGQVQFAEAYARVEPGPHDRPEVWVHGMHIAPYEQGNIYNVEPRRKRKLLLHRAQIDKLAVRVQQKGYTLVPLKFYFTRGKAKLELGIGKGRKTHDKRQVINEREARRDAQREMSNR